MTMTKTFKGYSLTTTIPSGMAAGYRRWTIAEQLREHYANCVDAVTDGAVLKTKRLWRRDGKGETTGTVRLETIGRTMDRSALLLGTTTKRDAPDGKYIGRHAEGMKVSSVELVSAGHSVVITTGTEKWVPRLEKSDEHMGAEQMVWDIYTSKRFYNGVLVEIGGVEKEDWDAFRSRCLALVEGAEASAIEVPGEGRILTHPTMAGKLFSHGLYVCEMRAIHDVPWRFGYDIDAIDINHDRNLVDAAAARSACRYALSGALSNGSLPTPLVYDLLDPKTSDGRRGRTLGESEVFASAYYVSSSATKCIASEFKRRHGEDTRPYLTGSITDEEAYLIEGGCGVKVQSVPAALWQVLEIGGYTNPRDLLASGGGVKVTICDQRPSQLALEVMKLIHAAESGAPVSIFLGDFVERGVRGMYSGGQITLSRKVDERQDFAEILQVLVHEVAHAYGGDLSTGHVNAISRIHADITAQMRRSIPGKEVGDA